MYKKYFMSLMIFVFLTLLPTLSLAAPTTPDGQKIELYTYWFKQSDSTWGSDIYAHRFPETIKDWGCATSSLAMLYQYHGMNYMPDENHKPDNQVWFENYSSAGSLVPGNLNEWLVGHSGYNRKGGVRWDNATNSLYYHDWPWTGAYVSLKFNYYCSSNAYSQPYSPRNYVCFRALWTDLKRSATLPSAQSLLDYDLEHGEPDILKILHRKRKGFGTHFVLVAGYDPAKVQTGIRAYSVYDPGKSLLSTAGFQVPFTLDELYSGATVTFVELYRFKSSLFYLNKSKISVTAYSPVEMEIIDPQGRRTGYDAATGDTLQENPMSLYYHEDPPSSLDGDDIPSDPAKVLSIAEPLEGNYILKIFGTGDGPYTIDIEGTTSDGTTNLTTSLTGTATSSLYETYRIAYSPTGEASLSQANQAPVASAGLNQTGEQSYVIGLDGSASSDPDGDSLIYTWSFLSKPNNSEAALSDPHAVRPTFTPDLPGTYVLQLIVNDHFIDSAPSTVTVTATPVKSRISVSPNFSSPLSTGPGFISFDINNIGRVAISSGTINITLTDPDGAAVSTGSQTFSIGVGGTMTVNIPVSIPSLKLGNYILTYTQSDETRVGLPSISSVPNSSSIGISFDKSVYRVRDTANLTLHLINTGKFNLDGATLTVSMPDAGYTNSQGVTISPGQTVTIQSAIQIPLSIGAGQHYINAVLTLPSGSSATQTARFALQDSTLILDVAAPSQITVGSIVPVTVENQGSVDTTYTTLQLVFSDNYGNILYQGSVADSIMSGEKKTLSGIQVPSQFYGTMALLSVTLQDTKTGKLSYLNKLLAIDGLQSGLIARTDKDIFLNSEAITGTSSLLNGNLGIEQGTLKVAVSRMVAGSDTFMNFLPKTGWGSFYGPSGIAAASDGSVYVVNRRSNTIQKSDSNGNFTIQWGGTGTRNGQFNVPVDAAVSPDGFLFVTDYQNHRIQKFDSNGTFILSWGSYGSGNGQFQYPSGIAVAMDGSVYVTDFSNRIQKFNENGNFITTWGSYGSGNGQFNRPTRVAVAPDGSVYVSDRDNYRIQKFDKNGAFLTKWGSFGSNDGQFIIPCGIAVDSDGSVYVAQEADGRIQKFTSNGIFLSKWVTYESANGNALAMASDGSIYVAVINYRVVQKFDNKGNLLREWTDTGTDDGQFTEPMGIAVGPDASVFVADSANNRIQKFDSNGNIFTKWGSAGAGNGQFNYPSAIASASGGSVYVADRINNRIQKFDNNGNYLLQWGSRGIGDGQFKDPSGITVASDGSVYVADTGNNRIQKFDNNGNFLSKLGTPGAGNGQFNYPSGVAVAPDGSIYVADTSNLRIQKFDSAGNFLIKWSGAFGSSIAIDRDGYIWIGSVQTGSVQKFDKNGKFLSYWGSPGIGEGQFKNVRGIAAASDGSIYVADTGNNRIQKMTTAGFKTIFETTTPVNQAAGTTSDYLTTTGVLNTTGKLYFHAELKNTAGQTIAESEYPFYVINGNTSLTFSTDKKIYKPGEMVTITGEVKNLTAITAPGLNLTIKSQNSGVGIQNLLLATFDVPANGSHPFTITASASSEGAYTITGTVAQNSVTLMEIIDQYEVAVPKASVSITGPDVIGSNPFALSVQIVNTGKVDANIHYAVSNNAGSTIDSNSLTIPAGQTMPLQYTQQIIQTAIYSVNLSGDVSQSATKTVIYGEAATITTGQALSIYPEGTVSIPVTITNSGSVDESVSVTYTLSSANSNQIKTYFLPKGGSTTDTLTYALTKGTYQLSASSLLPSASASTSFIVAKDPDVAMTTTAGIQGANNLIPLALNVTNGGYSDLNGSIAVAVMNNQGKAVWRGETPVSGLKTQTAQNYVVNVDSSGVLPGAYSTAVILYSTTGQQLAVNQTQVRVLGPIFEITSVPADPSFTVGNQATISFGVKNTGTQAGSASLAVAAEQLIKQSSSNTFQPGEEKYYTFNVNVPEDAVPQAYLADYTLSSAQSQGTTGQTGFNVVGVDVEITAALDKEAYRDNDTAVLTLTITRRSQSQDGTYVAVIRYGAYHDMQSFFLSSQPVTLTFNVPLTAITGQRIFYGVYFQSGTTIRSDSVAVNPSQADLASAFTGSMTDDRVLTPAIGKDNAAQITATVANIGTAPSPATTVAFYEGDTLLDTEPVSALNPGVSADVSFAWNVLGKAGTHMLRAMVDPQDMIVEISKTNNVSLNQTVLIPDITLLTSADQDTYKIRQKVYITALITDMTPTTAYSSLTVATNVNGPSGRTVYTTNSAVGPLVPSASSTATVIWSTSGLPVDGTYTITQTATSDAQVLAQSAKTITLLKAPDFILTTDAGSRRIRQGEKATYVAGLMPFNGWDHEVSMGMDGLPAGTTVTFSPGSLLVPGQSQSVVISTDRTPIGANTIYLTAQGTDEGEIVSHSVPLTLDVAGFGIEAAAPKATILQLQKAVFPINLTFLNGYEGIVTLSVSGMPNGTKAFFDNGQYAAPGTGNLTVLTSKYAKPGTYTLTVTGDDGLVKHTLDLTLVLQPNPDIAVGIIATEGPGPQNDALVRLYNSKLGLVREFTAFDTQYGVSAISADIDGDGYDELIVAEGPGPTNRAVLRAYKRDGTLIAEYTAFDAKYGLTLGASDLDGDWTDELIVGMGPDPKNPGTIKILKFNGSGFTELLSQTIYPGLLYGINVAAGDFDGDGVPELITAPGPGPNNTASIKVWEYNSAGLTELSTFTAFDGLYGANIAAGDLDGDGKDEIIAGTGPDPKNPSFVRIFRANGTLVSEFAPYDAPHAYGVTVSSGDIDGDGMNEIITGPGPGSRNDPLIKLFRIDGTLTGSFTAYPFGTGYGVRANTGKTGQ